MSNVDKTTNYIEFPLVSADATKTFYSKLFGWEFTDWGQTYISFSGAGIEGGFNGEGDASATKPGILVVLYVKDLDSTLLSVSDAGGRILKPIYEFPGGRRFHFEDPNGNELAIWSEP